MRHTVAALRGVRGLASLPERATEQNSHGSTHRWLVGRILCWLDFMDIKDIMVCLDVMDGMDLLYCMALWSLWTQARRTTYELSVCEHMYTSIRTPSACISMYVAFSGVLFVRGLFDGLGLFLRSLSNACAGKKKKIAPSGKKAGADRFYFRIKENLFF